MGIGNVGGVIEVDEAFFRESFKGNHKKNLEISYDSSAGGGKLTHNFDSSHPIEKTYTLKSSGSGVAIEHKDETIKVNINLDGKIQTIELKNVQ